MPFLIKMKIITDVTTKWSATVQAYDVVNPIWCFFSFFGNILNIKYYQNGKKAYAPRQ
jgi:phosphate starvation-inducible membrane PsiE